MFMISLLAVVQLKNKTNALLFLFHKNINIRNLNKIFFRMINEIAEHEVCYCKNNIPRCCEVTKIIRKRKSVSVFQSTFQFLKQNTQFHNIIYINIDICTEGIPRNRLRQLPCYFNKPRDHKKSRFLMFYAVSFFDSLTFFA